MNRKDYKKIMQQKNRNKMVAKTALLASVGISVGLANMNQVEASEWKANTVESIQIKDGDTTYIIKDGDTLWAISEKSGITILTLQQLNQIANADLIFAGNTIALDENGVKIVDTQGNLVAQQPLSEQDKAGIAEKTQSNTNKNVSSSATGYVKNNDKTTVNNAGKTDGKINVSNNTQNKPTKPTKPNEEKPGTEKPEQGKEVTFKVIDILKWDATQEGGESHVREIKAKVGETITVENKEFEHFKPTQESLTVKVTEDMDFVTMTYVKSDTNIVVTVKHVDIDGKEVAKATTQTGELGTDISIKPVKVDEFEPVLETPEVTTAIGKNIRDNNMDATVVYKEVGATTPTEEKGYVVIDFIDEDGNKIKDSKIYEGIVGEDYLILAEPIDGYNLADEAEISGVYTKETQTYTFIYEKSSVKPIQNVDVAINHVTVDGEFLHSEVKTVKEGETVTASAESFDGYHLLGNATQSIVAKNGATITFTYEKDAPIIQDVTVNVIHVGDDGVTLGSSQIVAKEGDVVTAQAQTFAGYTLNDNTSKSTTAFDGATIQFNYAKDVKPPTNNWGARPTSNNELASGDFNGVWYDDQVGNSGMTFASQSDADNWGAEHGTNGWWSWEVRLSGTNEIRVTVDLY